MEQKDPDFTKRAFGYTIKAALVGIIVGASLGDRLRDWLEIVVALPWLPHDRFLYAILGGQLLGILGLIRAIKESLSI